ncbi:hypothetical protein GWI33_012519, partial [Rhynchophorus ferrugineus]
NSRDPIHLSAAGHIISGDKETERSASRRVHNPQEIREHLPVIAATMCRAEHGRRMDFATAEIGQIPQYTLVRIMANYLHFRNKNPTIAEYGEDGARQKARWVEAAAVEGEGGGWESETRREKSLWRISSGSDFLFGG